MTSAGDYHREMNSLFVDNVVLTWKTNTGTEASQLGLFTSPSL